MNAFFESAERQTALWDAAKRWERTPYFANAASRGHGVGCVELQHELWFECGAVSRLELPRYQIDYGQHATDPQLIRFLLDAPALRGRLVFVPVNGKRMPGDLIACRSGRTDHHLAQMLPWGKVVHAIEEQGVVIHGYDEGKFQERILYVLRLMGDIA